MKDRITKTPTIPDGVFPAFPEHSDQQAYWNAYPTPRERQSMRQGDEKAVGSKHIYPGKGSN